MSETASTLHYEWRWLRRDSNVIGARKRYVVIACGYRHLVLHRLEQYQGTDTDGRGYGGIRYVPVRVDEVLEGEV